MSSFFGRKAKDRLSSMCNFFYVMCVIFCINAVMCTGFVTRLSRYRNTIKGPMVLNYSPLEEESAEQLQARMVLVRKIQECFYTPSENDPSSGNKNKFPLKMGSTVLKDLPLYRVEKTQLPGYQTVLNVNEFDAHMFWEIISGKSKPWYFGHILLPGGSINLDNPSYELHEGTLAPLTGVLMKICDYQQKDDGTLMLIVQAIEKIKVLETKRHTPYAIATVQVVPEEELLEDYFCRLSEDLIDNVREGAAYAAYVAEALHIWQQFETRDVSIRASMIPGIDVAAVSPLSTYDTEAFGPDDSNDEIMPSAVQEFIKIIDIHPDELETNSPTGSKLSCTLDTDVLELERTLWIQLDNMMKILKKKKNSSRWKVTIPTQILGLLPMNPVEPWPEDFMLLESLQKSQRIYGTGPGSSFVVVDNQNKKDLSSTSSYPQLRRVKRLSYIVWFLLDIINPMETQSRQAVLEMESITERLTAAVDRVHEINAKLSEKKR